MSFTFPYGTGRVRFVCMFNYPKDIEKAAGEAWYLGELVPEARRLPGLVSFRSWKAPVSYTHLDVYKRQG